MRCLARDGLERHVRLTQAQDIDSEVLYVVCLSEGQIEESQNGGLVTRQTEEHGVASSTRARALLDAWLEAIWDSLGASRSARPRQLISVSDVTVIPRLHLFSSTDKKTWFEVRKFMRCGHQVAGGGC